jgi:hypothetical protein
MQTDVVTTANRVRSESRCALRLRYGDLVVSMEVAVVQCLMNNTNMVCHRQTQLVLYINNTRLHVSTLWGSSSGLYNALKTVDT